MGGRSAPASVTSVQTIMMEETRDRIVTKMTPIVEDMSDEDLIDAKVKDMEVESHTGHSVETSVMKSIIRFLGIYTKATGEEVSTEKISTMVRKVIEAGADGLGDLVAQQFRKVSRD